MRRALLALTLGGLLLTVTACDGAAETAGTAAPAATSAPATPTSPPPDYSADTKLVCGKLQKIFSDDLDGFATELGKMVARKEEKQNAEAEKAEKAAGQELKSVGTKIKKETAAAEDPELKAAGAASAAKLGKSAADAKFFDGIKTTKDLNRTIDTQMAEWLTPVAGYCL